MPSPRSAPAMQRSAMKDLRAIILPIARAHGARNVRLFGSFARGEQRKRSDIDLLVTLPKKMSLLDLAGLKVDLEEALRRKVDVVPDDSIKPALRKRILSEALPFMTLKARKDFGVYLTDIRNAIARIEDYTAVGEDTFLMDP